VEAEAILAALALCEAGHVELMGSDTLLFELGRNPHPVRKEYALKMLARSVAFVPTDNDVVERTRTFQAEGIKPLDALHLASAVIARPITSARVMIDF